MIKKFNQFINEAMATAYDEFGGGERRDNEYGF